MITYGQARPEEENDLLDFANYVFSINASPTDFKRLQPRVYARSGFSAITQAAREDGRIKGMVSAIRGTLRLSGRELKYGYIGTVSAHPYLRGQGIMKKLMELTIDSLREDGCHFIVLGGQRQRYQHYGFEEAGSLLTLNFTIRSLRHALNGEAGGGYSFTPFEQAGAEAREFAFRMHEGEDYRCVRKPEDFPDLMRTWDGRAYIISRQGRLEGYCYLIGDRVAECHVLDKAGLPYMLSDLMKHLGSRELQLSLPAHRIHGLPETLAAADSFEQSPACNLRVLDWAAFLEAFLGYQAVIRPLAPGRANLTVAGEGTFSIAVENGQTLVRKTGEPGDLALDPLAATLLCTHFISRDLYPDSPFHNWFPLPFSFPSADAF